MAVQREHGAAGAMKAGQQPVRSVEDAAPVSAIEVLLPVWGLQHIRSFLDFSLPTLLAPGNLPALVNALPCSVTVLTRRDEVPIFQQHPAFSRLQEICEVGVQTIDDLVIEGHHAVTLTLAYERAVRA